MGSRLLDDLFAHGGGLEAGAYTQDIEELPGGAGVEVGDGPTADASSAMPHGVSSHDESGARCGETAVGAVLGVFGVGIEGVIVADAGGVGLDHRLGEHPWALEGRA